MSRSCVLTSDRSRSCVLTSAKPRSRWPDWVRGLTLQDGSVAAGIGYDSRHATGAALAYWRRRVDDGHAAGNEPVTSLAGEWALDELDPNPQAVAPRFQLTTS